MLRGLFHPSRNFVRVGVSKHSNEAILTRWAVSIAGKLRHFSTLEVTDITKLRNIGISAHIDSGKTTTSERILFYTGKINDIHDVKGKDGVGAKMDSMELEREKGITIQSAATFCEWKTDEANYFINVIDTPGHVDFTIEVERALAVLDGAILILCGVAGVQSQTLTVFRQMERYKVPRIIFINKLDRDGANPQRVIDTIRAKIPNLKVALMQVPIGLENKHLGVVDVISRKAYYFEGYKGSDRVERECPPSLLPEVEKYRNELLSTLSDLDDEIAEEFIETEDVSPENIHRAIARLVKELRFAPVFMGTAHKNKGIQNLLDAVCRYLPSPNDRHIMAFDQNNNEDEVSIEGANSKKSLLAYAFKIQDTSAGQVTYLRLYQGTLRKNDALFNVNMKKKFNIKKILKMHSDEAKEIAVAKAGDIVSITGIDCASGTTFTDGKIHYTLQSMFVPDPVVQVALKVLAGSDVTKLSKALTRFQKEDPTFRVHTDEESKETILSGMGELHLDIYVERMRREYNLNLSIGEPKVNYREAIQQRVEFDYTHKRQTGGRGEYGKIIGYIEPIGEEERLENPFEFKIDLVGNVIPPNYFSSIEKGFREAFQQGQICGSQVIGVKIVITDGQAHEVDSSDLAFRLAAQGVVRQYYDDMNPVLLEPMMRVEVIAPSEYQQSVLHTLTKRKATISNSANTSGTAIIDAYVPLREMFGYINDLRGCTQGQGEFTMVFDSYVPMNAMDSDKLHQQYKNKSKK